MSRWAWPLLLSLAALALYANAIENPFLSDDKRIVVANPTVSDPSFAGLWRLWTVDYWTGVYEDGETWELSEDRNLYRPVTVLSYWINSVVTGISPAGFRFVNLLLHVTAAWIVGLWCARWFDVKAGWIASGIVLLHPVATDVVNRIVGRADILSIVGVAGFLLVQRTAQTTGWTGRRIALAALTTLVALGSKESGAALLPLAALQVWLGSADRDPNRFRAGVAIGATALAVLTARFAVVGLPSYRPALEWDALDNPMMGLDLLERAPASMSLLYDYLVLTLLPWPLFAFDVPTDLPGWSEATPWLGVVVLLGLVGITARLGLRRSPLALGPAWWLLGVGVVIQLVTPIGTYREVRLVYPLLAGLALVIGPLVSRLHDGAATRRRVVAVVVMLAAASMSLAVIRRNTEFRSESVWLEVDARGRPDHAPTMLRLATNYRANGRLAEAEELLQRAVLLLPDSGQAWFELARCLELRGDASVARTAYGRAVIANPLHGNAWTRFAALEMNAGRLDQAQQLIERAHALYPERIQVRYHRGLIDARRGRVPAAIETFEGLLEDHPDLVRVAQVLDHLKQYGKLPPTSTTTGAGR